MKRKRCQLIIRKYLFIVAFASQIFSFIGTLIYHIITYSGYLSPYSNVEGWIYDVLTNIGIIFYLNGITTPIFLILSCVCFLAIILYIVLYVFFKKIFLFTQVTIIPFIIFFVITTANVYTYFVVFRELLFIYYY